MSWKKGPLPPDTYGWGGVVPICLACGGTGQMCPPHDPACDDPPCVPCEKCGGSGLWGQSGFFFADFHGDKVRLIGTDPEGHFVSADEVKWYDNSLTLPPYLPQSSVRSET